MMFGKKRKSVRRSTDGRLIYAIGDVHGRNDLLVRMMQQIRQDCGPRVRSGDDRAVVILLGDYVDRGGQSMQVINHILDLRVAGEFEIKALKGNHEEAFLKFIEEPEFGPTWALHGGVETLASYGVRAPSPRDTLEHWEKAHADFVGAVPPFHRSFLETLSLTATFGDYVFVHAGVQPGRPLSEQQEHNLLWIRGEFLRHREPFEKRVVHGHTPAARVEILKTRIGVDTGAYASGVLSAVRLFEGQENIIQARTTSSI